MRHGAAKPRWAPLLLVAVALACADATGPADRFDVAIYTRQPVPPVITETAAGVRIACFIGFIAQGSGRGSATWDGATFRWFVGADRSRPVDSARVAREEVGLLWPSADVPVGRSDSTLVRFESSLPFELEAAFRFRRPGEGAPDTTTVRATCGTQPAGAAGLPSVRITSITASSDSVETGDTIVVAYEVAAPQGLWESGVEITAPFQRLAPVAEQGRTASVRQAQFVVPPGVPSGTLFTVRAYATDGAARSDDTLAQPFRIWDLTPPRVEADFRPVQRAEGESFAVAVRLADANGLRRLHYELGSPVLRRDSVTVEGAAAQLELTIPVGAGWSGADAGLRLWATDVAGVQSAVLASAPATYRFHETVAPPALWNTLVAGGGEAPSIADPARGLLYANEPGAASIAVVDVASFTRVATIALPTAARAFDLTPGGDSLLAVDGERFLVRVVDLTTRTLRDSISFAWLATVPGEHSPRGISVASNRKAFVALHRAYSGLRQLVEVDLATGRSDLREDFLGEETDPWWRWMAATPQRDRILLVQRPCIRWYEAATDTFSSCLFRPLDGFHSHIAFDPAVSRVGISMRPFTPDLPPTDSLPGHTLAFADDGATAFTVSGLHLYRIRLSDGRVMRRLQLPETYLQVRKVPGIEALVLQGYNGMLKIDLASF